MTLSEQIITILILVLVTVFTRAFPFLVFPPGRKTPSYVQYLGRVLPLAVFGMLVVYCIKDVQWCAGTHGLPEVLGIAVTILIHLWRRNMLWSIAGGTLFYIIIIRLV